MVEDRGATRDRTVGLIAGLGLGLVAAGASTAAYVGLRARRKQRAHEGLAPDSEFDAGRGEPRGPVNAKSREAGYEVEDTNIRVLAIIMVVSIAIMVAGVVGVFFMYDGFGRHFISQSKTDTAQQRQPIVPPLPHLQAEPNREIDATIMEQQRRLTSYGYAEPDRKGAHIPIERAMRQVVGKPLDGAAQADAAGVPVSTPGKPMPSLPAYDAARPRNKPANRVQGEGRPGAVAPSYNPAARKPSDSK